MKEVARTGGFTSKQATDFQQRSSEDTHPDMKGSLRTEVILSVKTSSPK
jgi:hypothetical protein